MFMSLQRWVPSRAPQYASDSHGQMILARKEEVTWLEAVGEEGMLHSILSSLPNLYEEGQEGDPSLPIPEAEGKTEDAVATVDNKNETGDFPNGDIAPGYTVKAEELTENASSAIPLPSDVNEETAYRALPSESLPIEQESSGDIGVARPLSAPSSGTSMIESDNRVLDGVLLGDKSPTLTENGTTLVDESITKAEPEGMKLTPTSASTPPSEPEPEGSDPWPDTPGQPSKARMSLSSLLHQADDLLVRFPPTHPKLDLDKIMGHGSTIFTWSESASSIPSDDELEQYVGKPHLVVLPYVDPVEEAMTKEKETRELEMRKVERRAKLRESIFSRANVPRRAALAGAVLALGIAVAVYGTRAPGDVGRGHHRSDLRRLLRYIGGLLLAGGDRFVGRLLGR